MHNLCLTSWKSECSRQVCHFIQHSALDSQQLQPRLPKTQSVHEAGFRKGLFSQDPYSKPVAGQKGSKRMPGRASCPLGHTILGGRPHVHRVAPSTAEPRPAVFPMDTIKETQTTVNNIDNQLKECQSVLRAERPNLGVFIGYSLASGRTAAANKGGMYQSAYPTHAAARGGRASK